MEQKGQDIESKYIGRFAETSFYVSGVTFCRIFFDKTQYF